MLQSRRGGIVVGGPQLLVELPKLAERLILPGDCLLRRGG
jgi:hypothetical protein